MSRAMALAAASSAVLGVGLLLNDPTTRNSRIAASRNACSSLRHQETFTRAACYYSVSGLLCGRLACAEPSSTRLVVQAGSSASTSQAEAGTGIQFSELLKLPGASTDLTLLGLGVREKKIAFLSVKVYAVGFYANKDQIPKDLSSPKSLSDGAFEKGLVIKLAREVEGALFCSALDEELKPRLKSSTHGEQLLTEFGSLFKNRSLKKGTCLYFTWIPPETLQVAISDGGSVPSQPDSTFKSSALASALFDVYLGEKPVSVTLKSSVMEAVKQLQEALQ